jgi:hypothetical protein
MVNLLLLNLLNDPRYITLSECRDLIIKTVNHKRQEAASVLPHGFATLVKKFQLVNWQCYSGSSQKTSRKANSLCPLHWHHLDVIPLFIYVLPIRF